MATTSPANWNWEGLRRVSLRETRRVLRSSEEAEDAAQEAIARAWRHRRSCEDPAAASRWVATIARHEALRRVGSRRPVPMPTRDGGPDLDAAASEEIEIAALRLDVRRALATLSGDEQRLLDLRYRADMTQRAVAATLGLPEGTVKVRLHRVRKLLHERLR